MSTEVTLGEVLAFREHISERKEALRKKYNMPVIGFTMNMAGSVKRTPLSDFAFRCGKAELQKRLGRAVFSEIFEDNAGICGFFVYDEKAQRLKEICTEIENGGCGRLYDLDVTDEYGNALHRDTLRKCLICERSAAECGRSRAHSIEEIRQKTENILSGFAAQKLTETAHFALIEELSLTPKPGLVDRNNCGAHTDMRYSDFEHSADAILPYFEKAMLTGFCSGGFSKLEALGIEAENAMFKATNGINTHKGAIFIFMLLLYACGKQLSGGGDIFSTVSALAEQKSKAADTHGAKMNEKYGGGVIEEAKSGFKTAKAGSETLLESKNPLRAFFKIMSLCNDTNLLWRGGEEALTFAKESAKDALTLNDDELIKQALYLDGEFIRRNISPGGSADLFSAAIFITEINKIFY